MTTIDEMPGAQEPDGRQAYVAAREFCLRQLKAPGTAVFYDSNRKLESVRTAAFYLGGSVWRFDGFVDAHNSFGALIRTSWAAEVKSNGGSWNLAWFRLGEEESGEEWQSTQERQRYLKQEEQAQAETPQEVRSTTADRNERSIARIARYRQDQAAKAESADKAALKFQQERANGGSADSQFRLGVRYLKGDGVAKDKSSARAWLEKARAQGHKDAEMELRRLTDR